MRHGKHLTRAVASDSRLLSLPPSSNSYIPLTLFWRDSQPPYPIFFKGKSLPSVPSFGQAAVCWHMPGTYSSRRVIKLTCPARGHWISISHLTLELLSLSKHRVLKLRLQQSRAEWMAETPPCMCCLQSVLSASRAGLRVRVVSVCVCGEPGLPT